MGVLCGTLSVMAQGVSGRFSQMPDTPISLMGYRGMQAYTIASAQTDKSGNFSLPYTAGDYGMGFLQAKNGKAFILALTGENVVLEGTTLEVTEDIHVTKGDENKAFEQYALEQPRREQALEAWGYLAKTYKADNLLMTHTAAIEAMQNEQKLLKDDSEVFLSKLPADSYVRWFLPVRRLVSSLPSIAMNRPSEIPEILRALRTLNYGDQRLYKSGLFKDALEGHMWFIENSSGSLDKVYADINTSIDVILPQLAGEQYMFIEVTDFLFHLLEERSLFTSSEYLAVKVLEQQSCSLPEKLANQLEGYRALKKGKVAPNIVFGENTFNAKAKDLKSIKAKFKLVVFAASWCPHCQEMMPKLAGQYTAWKEKGVEVVFVSLDDQLNEFKAFAADLPFVTTCDLKKWEGKAALDYHLFGTPTMYMLNQNLEILLKPVSVEQITSWLSVQPPSIK